MTNDNLPPLPQRDTFTFLTANTPVYTADQMREYAQEAIAESEAESLPKAWMAGKARAYEEMGHTALPWRGIDSAPTDTPILVASKMTAPCVAELRKSGACDDRDGRGLVPTHWMPIPPLPETKP